MPRKDAQPGKREIAADRRHRALEMRKSGASYRAIGAQLGVSEKTAHQDVQQALASLAELEQSSADELRTMELMRLDMAALALAPKLKTGDPAIVGAWVRISESRRKLLGLDMQPGGGPATNLEVTVRWHDDNRPQRIIDITPAADDHTAAIAPATAGDSPAPGALSYRVRWATMGQEPTSGDAEPQDGA